jgi:3-oxoacid CoA-transferase B subunit
MGGAMDLLYGCKRVVIAMTHIDKHGNPKIRHQCSLPLTGLKVVDTIITDKAVFDVVENGLKLLEIDADSSLDEIIRLTEANIVNLDDWKLST